MSLGSIAHGRESDLKTSLDLYQGGNPAHAHRTIWWASSASANAIARSWLHHDILSMCATGPVHPQLRTSESKFPETPRFPPV